MTPTQLKEQLIKQYNETVTSLKVLEGAIAACDELLKPIEEEETTND